MQKEKNLNVTERDYAKELLELIRSDLPPEELKDKLDNYHESDVAEVIPELTQEERLKLYKLLGYEAVSDIFAHLDDVEDYVEELSNEEVADIIEEMDADDAMDVLEELDKDKRQEIIELLDEETASDIKLLDTFDEDIIGSRMTTNFITIEHDYTVKQAMRSVIEQAADNDNISTIYAVNADNEYYGAISLRDLVVARSDTKLDDIISTAYPFLYADEKIEDCIEKLRDYYEDSIPLLDRANKIIGVITSSELVDVTAEEIEEDYAKFAGLIGEEDLKEPLFKSISKRVPWLLILLGLGLVVSFIIQGFQSHIPQSLIILYTFQSLILGMSGNTGTQSLGVTIRVLSGEELSRKEKVLFILKELRVGACNGLLIGLLAFVAIGAFLQFITPQQIAGLGISGFTISGGIGISLFAAMVVASLDGTLVPLLFKKIGVDPAVASGPLITTLNDLVAVCTYYGFSILIFVKIIGI